MSTSSTLGTVRYYTKDDPYFYTVDNRPLQDLAANILILANTIDSAFSGAFSFTNVTTPKVTFDSATVTNAYYGGASGRIGFAVNTTDLFGISSGGPRLPTGMSLAWSSGVSAFNASDTFLFRDAAGIIAERNGANAQGFRIYNTYTDPSNYERLDMQWTANIVSLYTSNGGTGSVRSLQLGVNNGGVWELSVAGHWRPLSDNARDLGGVSTQRLRNLFVAGQISGGDGTAGAPYHSFIDTTKGFYSQGVNNVSYAAGGIEFWRFAPNSFIGIVTTGANVNVRLTQTGIQDFSLTNEATTGNIVFSANPSTFEFRNAANAQTVRIYNTYTNSSNYERVSSNWTTNIFSFVLEALGTGVTSRQMQIGTAGTGSLLFRTNNTNQWFVGGTDGALCGNVDNTVDIGRVGATRPRSIYWGTQALGPDGTAANGAFAFASNVGTGLSKTTTLAADSIVFSTNGSQIAAVVGNSDGLVIRASNPLSWSSNVPGTNASDTYLYRGAANVIEQRNLANAQTFRVYNTYTDASNYERGTVSWSGNDFIIGTEALGTGTLRNLNFAVGGTRRWQVAGSTGHFLAVADNTYDVGATGASRPRDVYLAGLLQLENATTTGGIKLANTLINLDANNNIAIRNGANPQILHLYNTYTNSSNYERLTIAANGSSAYLIYTETAGAGDTTRTMEIGTQGTGTLSLHTNGTNRWQVQGSSGHMFAVADNTYDIGASGASRPRSLYLGSVLVGAINTVTLSGSITLDASLANEITINGTTNTAYTINVPTNPVTGQRITITIRNTSGGALGAATWNAVFKMVAWTNPLNTFSRSIEFRYDGTNWVERMRSAADISN